VGRKKKVKSETPPSPETKKKKPQHKYSDPCYHCQNMEMNSSTMKCAENCPEFWSPFQGFEDSGKSGEAGELCKKFKELTKPLKPLLTA
jgi:hypothetical protein